MKNSSTENFTHGSAKPMLAAGFLTTSYGRKLKNGNCIECNRVGIYCKNLCQACYSKMQRKTPEGKIRTKKYNDTKGREAIKRYLAKKPPKPPKPPKANCECGNISEIKNYCFKCYHKYYQRNNPKLRKPREKKDYSVIFDMVLKSVKKGFTIRESCDLNKITRSTLYRVITKKQKQELISTKITTRKLHNVGF